MWKVIGKLTSFLILIASCSKETDQVPLTPQSIQRFQATSVCTTYNSNGTILQVGLPYNHVVTKEVSSQPNFDFHFINFTGDNDTTVYAIENTTPQNFNVPSQQFKTSNGAILSIIGQGSQNGDSLNYGWSFYINPTYKSHDCFCKSRKL